MTIKSTLGSLLLLAAATSSFGQMKDYQFKFNVKGTREKDTIYLANYYGKQLYYNDTAVVDKMGNFTFKKKREIQSGQFAVVLPGSKYFEIIVNEPIFTMKTDTADFVSNMVIEGSMENKIFYDYIAFINKKKDEVLPIREQFDKAADEKAKEPFRKQMIQIDEDVKAYQKKIAAEHKNMLVGQIIGLSQEVEVPEAPKDAKGNIIDSTWTYYYYRDHYFDKINLKNDAVSHTPAFHNELEKYFSKVVLQNPDTICKVAKTLTDQMNPKGDMYKYTVTHVTDTYNKSNIMGMDAVFVCMAHEFYLSGKAYWADSARIAKIDERVRVVEPLLLGKTAHPLSLADTSHQNWIKMAEIKNDYTVLIFWDPDCGHCKKEVPKLAEIYNKSNGKDFGVYAVSSDDSEKWTKFIIDNNMKFINVAVPKAIRQDQDALYKLISNGKTDLKSLNYHDTFDVYSTPKVFILDKDKKIVAKQIGIEQLEDLLKQLREVDSKRKS